MIHHACRDAIHAPKGPEVAHYAVARSSNKTDVLVQLADTKGEQIRVILTPQQAAHMVTMLDAARASEGTTQ